MTTSVFLRLCKPIVKRIFKNFSLCLRYILHGIWLAIEMRRCRIEKKIPVFLCIANPGSIGGTELQVQIIAEALKARFGNCLVIINGKLEGGKSNLFLKRLNSLEIPVLRLRSLGLVRYDDWPFLTKCTAYLLSKILKTSKICHFFNPGSTALAPVIKTIGISIYYMETGMPAADGCGWKILHSTISYFNYVSSVTAAGLRSLELFYGYKGPSCVIPSMVNSPARPYLCKKPAQGIFDIVYFGRMTQTKGVNLLIEAFSRLRTKVPYARLTLIGSGKRKFLDPLQNRIKELRLSDSIQILGWLQDDALFSHLSSMDLFCLPSFTEGLPCSILEAMSIGLPIVATSVGGIPEIIEHNVSGLLIPPRDEEALTKALLELADDPLRRNQLREAALESWGKVGAKDVVLDRLISAYRITPF